MLFLSTRGAEPDAPPNLMPLLATLGGIVAAVLLVLGLGAGRGERGLQIAAAIAFGLWSLLAGLLGLVLTLLWTVTDHYFAHANENLLLFNPLWLVLVVLLPMYWLSGRAERSTRVIAYTIAATSLLALLGHVVGISRQHNLDVVALELPAALRRRLARWPSRRRGRARAAIEPRRSSGRGGLDFPNAGSRGSTSSRLKPSDDSAAQGLDSSGAQGLEPGRVDASHRARCTTRWLRMRTSASS